MSQTQQYGSGKLAYSVLGFIKFFFVGSLRAQQCSCNASTYIWVPSFPVSLPGLCFIKTFWHLSYCVVRACRWHNQHRASWHAQVNFTVRATSGWCIVATLLGRLRRPTCKSLHAKPPSKSVNVSN